MGTPETSREPCPDRILDDLGGAFGMGAVGGSAFHFLKGIYNSPSGSRLAGGSQAVRMNAPRVGGSFAVWGGLFSAFDCTMVYVRQKEDPWNSIMAGAATGGFLQMRQGLGASARSALFGGVLLALIEGAGIMLNKVVTEQQPGPVAVEESPPGMPGYSTGQAPVIIHGRSNEEAIVAGAPGLSRGEIQGMMLGKPAQEASAMSASSSSDTGSGSWFGGWFGGGNKKEPQVLSSSGSDTKVLESFDAPPVPNFEYK